MTVLCDWGGGGNVQVSSGLQDYRGANAAKDVVPGGFPELVTLAATGAGHTEVTGRPLEILPT